MVILVAHTKGGVGKTILACNLAGLFAKDDVDVLLLDADRQATAASWSALRTVEHPDLPKVACTQVSGKLHLSIPDLERRFELIIVDAGGFDSVELRSSLFVADLHLLPLPPSNFGLWALDDLEPLLDQARLTNRSLRTIGLINRAPTHYLVRDTRSAIEHLEARGIELARSILHDRRAFRRSEADGLTVPELRPVDPSARYELTHLYRELRSMLQKQAA